MAKGESMEERDNHEPGEANEAAPAPASAPVPASTPAARDTIWSAPFLILTGMNFLQSMAAFMTNTTLPLYMDYLGVGAGMVGIIVGAFAISALLVRPFAGPAFDSFSRKRMLMAAQCVIALAFLLYSLVKTPAALFAVRLLHGLGIGCAGPLSMTLVSEYLPPKKLASGVSIYMLSQSLAQVIGPAFGIWFAGVVGFQATYLLAAVLLALSVTAISRVREIPREMPPYQLRLGRMFAREALDKALVLMLFAAAFAGTTSYLVLYATKMGVEGIGLYFTVYALCLLATRPLYGRLADAFGAPRVLLPGVLCFAAAYLILPHVTSLSGFLLVAVVASAGFGACVPLVQSLAMASVPADRRGAASNTSFTGMDAGSLVGPMLAGGAIELLTPVLGGQMAAYSAMWYVMLVPILGALAVITWWNVRLGH